MLSYKHPNVEAAMFGQAYHTMQELSSIMKSIPLGSLRQRLQIVLMAKTLASAKNIGEQVGISKKGVHDLVSRYNEGGVKALESRRAPGRVMDLTPTEKELICERIEQGPKPTDGVCTLRGKDIQRLLKEEFGKIRSLSAVYYLLHQLGYSCLAPRPRHYLSNSQAQEHFKNHVPLAVAQLQKAHPDKKIQVWFEDEARFGQQGTLTKVWAKKGCRPTATGQTQYEYLYVLAAVCPASGQAEGLFYSSLNTSVMNLFLSQLSQSLPKDVHLMLILDRAGYHTSKKLQVPSNITLYRLPPYSPELNPVENLWHYLRSHHWSNRYYKDLLALQDAAQQAWDSSCLNPEIIQSVCRVHYAA